MEHNLGPNQNLGDCPDWCILHANGEHVGEMTGQDLPLPDLDTGRDYHIAAGPRQRPDGVPYVQLNVLQDGGPMMQVPIALGPLRPGEL